MAAAKMQDGLGAEMYKVAHKGLKDCEDRIANIYTWIDEYIADAKRTLSM